VGYVCLFRFMHTVGNNVKTSMTKVKTYMNKSKNMPVNVLLLK